MSKNIYIPNDEQLVQMFENAWSNFYAKAQKAGYKFEESEVDFFKELFIAGYCVGYSETLNLIRDQFRMMDFKDDVLKMLHNRTNENHGN